MKEDIHRLYNKIIKDTRKRQYLSNQGPEIRNDVSQNGDRKKERQESLIELLKNNMKTLRNLGKNTNGSRIDIHE